MRTITHLSAALAAALLLAGCGSGTDTSLDDADASVRKFGEIAFTPCSLSNPFVAESVEAQCATFDVAENPAKPEGRRIALNIAWLPPTDDGIAAPDPVFFLAGGPGQSAIENWPSLDAAFREVRKHRNVVLVDQRGTGKSNPLICRNAEGDSAVTEEMSDDAAAAAAFAKKCAASLDADPRFYATTDAVRDLDAVRAALDVEEIDVVGVSYGTRVAQQYAQRHPQHTRTVLLDGVVPNELALGSEHGRNLDAALDLQFKRCQELPACRSRFGEDVGQQLHDLKTRLEAQPVEVDYRDPSDGSLRHGTASAGAVVGLTRMFSYAPHAASLLPLVLSEAQQGRMEPLMALAQMIETQTTEGIMHGMQLSVICAEDADLLRDDPAEADTMLGGGLNQLLSAQCTQWPHGKRPDDFHAPFQSQVPTLLLSGELDPVTPPRYGDDVVANLANGRHLVLRGQGHNVLGAGCMPKLMGQFIETADAKALDTKCLDALDYVPPFTGFNGWEP